MAEYLFPGGEILDSSAPDFQAALAEVYRNTADRAKCLCAKPPPPMYVAKRGELYIIKRMPNTAELHAAHCESYEPPAALSGKAEVLGGAIKHDDETGLDKLLFGFSLARGHSPGVAPSAQAEPDSVKAEPNRLTLLGFLHYLWEQAGLVRWAPFQPAIRWEQVRDRVLRGAEGATAKNHNLREMLWLPEAFDRDHHAAQEARRSALFRRFDRAHSNGYLLCVGELKAFDEARGMHRLTLKHAPGVAFLMDAGISSRFGRRYRGMMSAWAADEKSRLVVAMTCAMDGSIPHVIEVAMMATLHNWIPFEGPREKELVAMLQAQEREFIKTLRYNLRPGDPVASAILTDAGRQGVALFLPPDEPGQADAWQKMIQGYNGPTWEWSDGPMPDLPLRAAEADDHFDDGSSDA